MKHAMIVGGSSGIGRGLAISLAKENIQVGVTGRRKELLNELAQQFPGLIRACEMDVRRSDQVIGGLEFLSEQLGRVELIVICAGIGELNPGLDFEIERPVLETNVLGFTQVADWAFRYLQKQGGGQLAAITSIGGLRGSGPAPSYNASKAYQLNYLEGLRQKATKEKIPVTVTEIRAGFVDTDMAKGEGLFWVAPVSKAVAQIRKGMARRKRVVYVTRRWRLVSWLLKAMPRPLMEKL